jgi:hypothetical protein
VITCPSCGHVNEDDVVFCHECYEQLKVHSKQDIARLQQTSLCPACDYYNPIEEDVCVRCGTPLRNSGVVIRNKDGRVSVLREAEESEFFRNLMWIFLALELSVMLTIGYYGGEAAGSVISFLSVPAGRLYGLIMFVLFITMAVEWDSGLLYRTKLCTVFLLSFLTLGLFSGDSFIEYVRLGSLNFQVLLLVGLIFTLVFSTAFIVRTRIFGSGLAPFMALMGLYCISGPIIMVAEGKGLLDAFRNISLQPGTVPFWLSPTFLAYHVFLPYTLVQMTGSALLAILRSMEKVDGTKSIVRFLNRRKEEARGELLNIFVVFITLFSGFYLMHVAHIPNVVSLAVIAVSRFF